MPRNKSWKKAEARRAVLERANLGHPECMVTESSQGVITAQMPLNTLGQSPIITSAQSSFIDNDCEEMLDEQNLKNLFDGNKEAHFQLGSDNDINGLDPIIAQKNEYFASFRIAALNESYSSEGSQSEAGGREATKEAKEAEAFTLYGKALDLLRQGKSEKAEEVFHDLIDHEFLIEAYDLLEERGKEAIHPGLQLLYSIQKNLATMATKRKDYKTALECYLEAVKIDNSEVTVWYKVGVTALVLEDFQLAMLAFEQGLDCNPKHWPCLDNVISILYALNNYLECLYYIARAFELDVTYGKGYALRNKIFAEQSSLKKDTEEFFENCDRVIYTFQLDSAEAKEYVEEALEMRRRNQVVCTPPDPELITFPARIKQFSWKTVGEILIDLYDKATTSDPPLSLGLRVDVPDYKNMSKEEENSVIDIVEDSNNPESGGTILANKGTENVGLKDAEKEMDCDETEVDKKEIVDLSLVETSGRLDSNVTEVKTKEEINSMNVFEGENVTYKEPTSVNGENATNECPKIDKVSVEKSDIQELETTEGKQTDENLETKKEDTELKMETSDNCDLKNMNKDTDCGDNTFCAKEDDTTKVSTEIAKRIPDETIATVEGDVLHSDVKDEKGSGDKVENDSENVKGEVKICAMEGREDNKGEESMEFENVSEDSSSIQEALMAAHALLDSLSPMKPQNEPEVFPGCLSSHSPKCKTDLGTSLCTKGSPLAVKVNEEIEKPSSAISEVSESHKTFSLESKRQTVDSQSSSSILTKTPSYGFTVSDILSDEKEQEKNSDVVMEKKQSEPSDAVTNEDGKPIEEQKTDRNVDPKSFEIIDQTKSCASPVKPKSIFDCSPVIIDSSSSSQEPQSRLQTVTVSSVTNATALVQSPGTQAVPVMTQPLNLSTSSSALKNDISDQASSSLQTDSSVISGYQPHSISLVSSGTSLTATSSSVTTSVGNTLSSSVVTQSDVRAPVVNITSPIAQIPVSVSEHGYSRAYNEMPLSQSTPMKSPFPVAMGARSPGGTIVLRDSQSSASYIEVPLDLDDKSPSSRKSLKRKRPSLATEDILNYGKRRSARVRNTGGRKKEEETVNFFDLLQTFLPASLKNVSEEESVSMETDRPGTPEKMQDKDIEKSEGKTSSVVMVTEEWDEAEMVKCFLDSCIKNCGLLDMCCTFLHILARHCKVKWPEGLSDIYMKVFGRVRKHLYIPNVFEMRDPSVLYQKLAQICLVQAELLLDSWLVARSKVTGSALMSPRSQGSHSLAVDEIPEFYDEDIWYLTVLCGYSETLADIWIDHCIRVYWLKTRYSVLRNKMVEAVACLETIKEYLEYGKEELNVERAHIPNCKIDNFVDLDVVTSLQELLQQTRSVEETEQLYEQKDYKKVVEILLQNFTAEKQKKVKMTFDTAERQAQLIMLQEALFKTGDFNNCLLWGEESLNECYQMSQHACKSDEKSSWIKTMINIFSYIQRVFRKNITLSEAMPVTKIVRFSQNLIKLIDLNMSLPEHVTEMAVDTVLPWILLYHVIKQEEGKNEESRVKEDRMDVEEEENMTSSHMLLNIAHDYLGSRSWCTKSDGALLLFFMSVLKKELSREPASKFLEEYQQAFEQCVYCLFGHPNKKGKAKHLQDHNGSNIPLKWEHAVDVFEYFKPKMLPEFDGYRSETISAEVEFLLKRIIALIPESSKTMGLSVEEIQSYIEGTNSSTPVIQEGRKVTLPVVDAVHYLVADYYLKNKEAMKAIKFYMQDLCMNPSRLDSWAGMALARMSQLDAKLTSAELKMDQPIYKKSIAALRCFKRAVEIDDTNSKLWIEYGTLAYQLHSHASRQIRWKKWFAMDEETVKIAVDSKREMLQTATDCFKMAAGCDRDWSEDEWLHNYMLGKCLEKQNKGIKDSLAFYQKALEHLHAEHAKYPKRIQYAYNTPHLAVEALEMYYRIHVVILKALLKHGADSEFHDYKAYVKYIVETASSPFVKRIEYGQTSKTDRDSASSADENSCMETTPSKSKQPSSDHTYFRQKSLPGVAPTTESVAMETEKVGDQNTAVLPGKSVTTLELHSEEQKTEVDITMTTMDSSGLPVSESTPQRETTPSKTDLIVTKADKESANLQKLKLSPFSISSILGEKTSENTETPAPDAKGGGEGLAAVDEGKKIGDMTEDNDMKQKTAEKSEVDSGAAGDGRTASSELAPVEKKPDKFESSSGETEKEVKSILSHIEDLIEEEMKDKNLEGDGENGSQKSSKKDVVEVMEVDDEDQKNKLVGQQKSTDEPAPKGDTKIDDQINRLLKMPACNLHKELTERCRQALVTCLQRFPTHYKSYYRLAYVYLHSPYHKDLTKAHHILLGAPKWQELGYMPCQGLFGERKQTKFFQGIWKIPIDEIDRSGSFPSHLNRCIELILEVLRAEKDSHTLHQVHLQLNRQPEPGKKYLRDAEKRYYALTSHRYTLDAVEQQIEDMRTVTDADVRQKFLTVVYKIHEHGVHKLNKHVDRTNRLLAEAYRVVIRKLETLPQKMLLDQAVRYCKQLLAQKSKSEKTQESKSQTGTSASAPAAVPTQPESADVPTTTVKPPNLISLANIMKSQVTNYSLLKATQSDLNISATENASKESGPPKTEVPTNEKQGTDQKEEPDIIILSDSSVESPVKSHSNVKSNDQSVSENTKTVVATDSANAPTVKIKMGLLQAVKRLKPNGKEGTATSGDNETSQDEGVSSAVSEDESEAPLPSASDDQEVKANSQTSSSSSSSSSESSSSEEDSDDDADKESADESKVETSSSDESENDDDEDNGKKEVGKKDTKEVTKKPEVVKQKLKVVPTTEDEEESSDNDDEIDLISSEDEPDQDDDKDKDYNASEDEIDDDIIMISDEEYAPKGKAVIPSPPHENVPTGTEVLVKEVPDFDASLITSLMSSEVEPVANASQKQSLMDVDKT